MREVRIIAWCDFCPPDERKPSAGAWSVAIAEGEGKAGPALVIDACDEHTGQFQALAEAILEHGAPVSRAAAPSSPSARNRPEDSAPCPVCGFVSVSYKALRGHMRKVHDAAAADFRELDQYRTHAPREAMTCPECGQSFIGGQGLGAHRRAAHGVIGANNSPNRPGRPANQPTLGE